MNRADLLVLVGLTASTPSFPRLLEASKNPRIQTARPATWIAPRASCPMDVPKSTEHSAGDVHPYGNPH